MRGAYMSGFWHASAETLYRCDYSEAHLYVSDANECGDHKAYIVAMDNYINTPCIVSLIKRMSSASNNEPARDIWSAKLDIPDGDQMQSLTIRVFFDIRRSTMVWLDDNDEMIFEWVKDVDLSNAVL